MKRAIVIPALLLLAAVAPRTPPRTQPKAAPTWDIKTSQMNANAATGRFSAPNHVTMLRADGSTVDADRADGNYKAHQATLYGHVTVHDAGGTFGLRSASAVQGRGPATLTADKVALDDAAHTYDASGDVHYEQGDTSADAQNAHLNDLTHVLELNGKVHVVQGDRTMDSEHATYNTQTGQGESDKDVTITMPGPSPSIATPKPLTIHKPKIP